MPEEKKTLEMRVAELEDKLAQVHISEDEMSTYHKVAAKLGGAAPCASPGPPPPPQCAQCVHCIVQHCVQCIHTCVVNPCIVQHCTQCVIRCIVQQCIVQQCIRPITTNDCIGPCAPGNCAAGGTSGGGFGGFGG
jgi:hypothetical protein